MEPLKRLIGELLVLSAVILAVLAAGHPAVAAPVQAASPIESGPSGTSTGTSDGSDGSSGSTSCCTSDGTSDGSSGSTSDGSGSTSDGSSGSTSDGSSGSTSDGSDGSSGSTSDGSDGSSGSTSDGTSDGSSESTSDGTSGSTSGGSDGTSGGPPSTGNGVPIALVSGVGGGLGLVAVFVLWALASPAGKRHRDVRWVKEHLRAVAGSSFDPPSAAIRSRPGAKSVSLGLEPHADHLGNEF